MAVLFKEDFELGSTTLYIPAQTHGTATVTPAAALHGSYGLLLTVDGTAASTINATADFGAGHVNVNARIYLEFLGPLPTGWNYLNVLELRDPDWTPNARLRIYGPSYSSLNQVEFGLSYIKNGALVEFKWGPVQLNRSYCIEIDMLRDAANASIDFYIDDVSVFADSGFANPGTTEVIMPQLYMNLAGQPTAVYMDDIVVDGASHVGPIGAPPPPGQTGSVTVNALQDSTAIAASVTLDGQSGNTPVTFTVPVGTYTLAAAYEGQTLPTQSLTIVAGQTVTVNLHFQVPVILNVSAGANGSVSPSGSQTLTAGQSYSFQATPNPSYKLDHWDLNGVNMGAANPYTLTAAVSMNGQTLTAIFIQLTVALNVAAGANGAVSPQGSQTLVIGQSYSFAAIPNPGYVLNHWDLSGANLGSSNPLPLVADATMNGKTLTAVFTAIPPVQISVNVATSGNGTVNPAAGPHTLNVGDTVQFTATPAPKNTFVHWTLDGVIYLANPASIQISQSMNGQTLTAVFAVTAITLTVAAGSNGSVTPSGTQILTVGQQYLFDAVPNVGYQVDHWDLSGASLGSSALLTITATADMDEKGLTALFTAVPPPQITMNLVASGSGTTNPAPGAHVFNVGDTVEFTAIPAAGQTFKQWALDGTVYMDNPLPLTITAAMQGMTLTAEFTGPPPGGLDLPTVGGILLGIADVGLMAWGTARLAGIV